MTSKIYIIAALSLSAISLSSCAGGVASSLNSSETNKRMANFNITPNGTLVTLTDPKTKDVIHTCSTPCSVEFFLSDPPNYTMTYPGMADKKGSLKSPYVDKNGRVTGPLLLTRGAVYVGDKTLKGEMRTPEAQAEADRKTEERVAAAKAEREEQRRFSAAQTEAYQTGDYSAINAIIDSRTTQCAAGQAYPNDEEAKPLVRIAPIMPPQAKKSGHCTLEFNVDKSGNPAEIKATYCTDEIFNTASRYAVSKWKYQPKFEGGIAVESCGVEAKISYKFMNSRGKVVPE